MMPRRRFLGALAAAPLLAGFRTSRAELRTISRDPRIYHGWPTLARTKEGRLLLAWSGGREAHVCPFGRVDLMQSDDGGKTWTWPRTILDGAIDDRDAGLCVTPKGTILATTFTSLAYAPLLEGAKGWSEEKLDRWRGVHGRLSADARRAELGCWMIRSTDGGTTWSARLDALVNSPHGPCALADGRLLYAGKELWKSPARNGVCESTDDGATWRWLAEIPARDGDDPAQYHELHAVQAADGRVIVQIRNHNKANAGETLQSESSDGGRTWSTPRAIGVWGLPSHLLKLRDGRLLMSYGHRRPPFGNLARTSGDGGRTWAAPITISDDGAGGDLGYPSTAELDDGTLVTVWYEKLRGSEFAVLRQATWRLGP